MATIERVMDDHLASREELDVRTADAPVRNLFVLDLIAEGNDVEDLAHRWYIGSRLRATEAATPIPGPGHSSGPRPVKEPSRRVARGAAD